MTDRVLIVAKIILAVLATIIVASRPTVRHESALGYDIWMLALPFGHEIDYQRHQASGSWMLFWQGADGGSLQLASETRSQR